MAQQPRKIRLEDLPLRDLRSKLIENGEPLDLSILALVGQVADFGRDGVKVRFNRSTSTFPGASNTSTSKVVDHGLGAAPIAVLLTPDNVGPWVATLAWTFTATQFTWAVRTIDGSLPAAATATAVYWLALA